MKIEHLKIHGAASELKEISDYLDKRILFHKSVAELEDPDNLDHEKAQHILICIELYDLKEFIYNRLLQITKDLNLNTDGQAL